jgi:ABC-2 type transport system ATP-binding protein
MSVTISVKDIHKTFRIGFFRKKMAVLRGVSFEVQEGEVFGFLGPNGCGKTTTIKILLGLIFADSGSTEIFNESCDHVDFKKDIGFLPDSPYFYSYLTGEEFLRFYGQLFGIPSTKRDEKVDDLLGLVGLKHARKLQLRKYSRGMLQRIGMAQALINDPKLVIMDEPMEGLDPVGRKHFRDIIIRLRDEGKTVFFSTHILSDVEMICDRVAIMVKGKIKDVGLLGDLLSTKIRSVDVCIQNQSDELVDKIREKHPDLSIRGDYIYVNLKEEEVNPLLNYLTSKNVPILSVIPHRESLEELFMSEVI